MSESKKSFVTGFIQGVNQSIDGYVGLIRFTHEASKAVSLGTKGILLVVDNETLRSEFNNSVEKLGEFFFDEGVRIKEKFDNTEGLKDSVMEAFATAQESWEKAKTVLHDIKNPSEPESEEPVQ